MVSVIKAPATPLFLAWAAGFFDGEGSVLIARSFRSRMIRRPRFWFRITATQLNPLPVVMLRDAFGGSLFKAGDGAWRWTASSNQAASALRAFLPWLTVKRAAADVGLRFQDLQSARVGGLVLNPEEIEAREALRVALHNINKGHGFVF